MATFLIIPDRPACYCYEILNIRLLNLIPYILYASFIIQKTGRY